MPVYSSSFLYVLDENGNSTTGKVESLVPDSDADATEETEDNFATLGEPFEVVFTASATNDIYGGTYTYVGHLTDYPAVVGQNENGDYFLFSNDGSIPIGSNLTGFVAEELAICFLTGTMIACPGGESAVESLKIDDLVLTADGRTVPVKWLGRQTISTFFGMPEPRRPIRICAGALGEGLPVRDLRVTADHALLIDGVLVHAAALVNGTTIRSIPRAELGQRFIVYHVETEDHEVILAEGTPAETFVDNVARSRFDNYAEFVALYGEAPEPIPQLTQPRAMSRRQLPAAIKARVAAAAAQLAGSESMAG